MSANKCQSKDAQVMASILSEMGISDYEPRLINQMLEFTNRYVTCLLEDALLFSSHAKKKNIDMDDVRLAIQLQVDKHFISPPPREILIEVSKQKNHLPLPLIKTSAGLRLPPDRYSLTACNYRLKSSAKKPRVHTVSRVNLSSLQTNAGPKLNPALNLNNKSLTMVVTKPNASPAVTIMSRTTTSKSVPTPIIKISEGNKNSTPISSSPLVMPVSSNSIPISASSIMLPTVGAINTDLRLPTDMISGKRKREDDLDDYDQE